MRSVTPEPALLGFLQNAPMHGYDLHKQVVSNLGAVWRLGLSQMYAILKEYQTRGWIETIVEPQAGRPPRKMLKLTPEGRRAFDAWMKQSAHGLREMRVDFFARLYFARAAGRSALRAFLAQQIAFTRQEYRALRQATPESEFAETVLDFRRAQLQSLLAWLETQAREAQSRNAPARRARDKTR